MKNANDVPLSNLANSSLSNNFGKYFWFSLLMSCLGGAEAFFFGLFGFAVNDPVPLRIALYFACAVPLTWLINFILAHKAWRKGKEKILQQNEIDYVKSLSFKAVLEIYAKPRLDRYPPQENEYRSQWRPFRVEHYLSNFLRGEMNGRINLHGFAFITTHLEGSVSRDIKGMTIPNLLDHSSVVFLKNGKDTLRVLIPSPRAVKELLARTLEHWLKKLPVGSYVYESLKQFSVDEENFVSQISHPRMIDSLDAACELPLESRPEVIVRGEKVQDGIVLATSLEIEGKEMIFLPSGFFRELAEKMISFIETAKESVLIETVKEK